MSRFAYRSPRAASNEAVDARPGEVVLGMTCPSGGTLEIFLEPHLARPQLVVLGGNPAARMLSRLGTAMGFRSCEVAANLDLSGCEIGPDSWVVVATMGHYDEEALEAALTTDAAYIGLIASRRRRNAIVQALRRRGWSGDALSSIVNPAGKTLGDAQEDIALSVLADIVDRRNKRKRRLAPSGGGAWSQPGETESHNLDGRESSIFADDPVCGMAVEIEGARYRSGDVYFCGSGCLEAYESEPSHYAGIQS